MEVLYYQVSALWLLLQALHGSLNSVGIEKLEFRIERKNYSYTEKMFTARIQILCLWIITAGCMMY